MNRETEIVVDRMVRQRLKEASGDAAEAIRAQLQRATRITTKANIEEAAESTNSTNHTEVIQPTDSAGKPLNHYLVITNPGDSARLDIMVSFEIVRDDGI